VLVVRGQEHDAHQAILQAIRSKLSHEPHLFSETDLDRLRTAILRTFHKPAQGEDPTPYRRLALSIGRIEKLHNRIKYLRLKEEILEGSNPEINTDQQIVFDRTAKLGFSPKLQNALREIDKKLRRY
jgi:hypothetical protein